jgi:hypothetical protein
MLTAPREYPAGGRARQEAQPIVVHLDELLPHGIRSEYFTQRISFYVRYLFSVCDRILLSRHVSLPSVSA